MCKNILRDWADISVASIPGPKWVKDPIFVNVLHLLCLALSNCANIRISQFCQMQTSILRVGDDLIFWSNQKFVSPVPGSYFLHNSESKLWSCWGHRGRRMQAMWWKRADTAEESQYYYSTNIIIEQAGGSLASYISTLTVWFYINRTLCRQTTLYNETDHRILVNVTVRRKCRCPSFIGTPIIWSGFTEHYWILYNETEYFTEHCWRLYNETEYCRPALLYWCFYCSDCLFKPNTNKSKLVGIQKCTYMLNLYGRSIK